MSRTLYASFAFLAASPDQTFPTPKEMSGGLEKIQTLEDSTRLTREEQEDVTTRVAPRFTVPFNNIDDLREGENAHFEARLTPVDDPKLKVSIS